MFSFHIAVNVFHQIVREGYQLTSQKEMRMLICWFPVHPLPNNAL